MHFINMWTSLLTCALLVLQMLDGSAGTGGGKYEDNSVTVEIAGITYFFSDNSRIGYGYQFDWDEANSQCKKRSMNLAGFETKAEYEAVRDWLIQNKEYDSWRWTCGKELTRDQYTWEATRVPFSEDVVWAPYEPEYSASTWFGCVHFYAFDQYLGKERGLYSTDCNGPMAFYICEQP